MNGIFLSICIPTKERAEYLKALLGSIDIPDDFGVEIIVSDNASKDDTGLVVGEFAMRYPNVVYRRLEVPSGFADNLLNAVRVASGKYLWLMGDDDLIEAGAVRDVCISLKECAPPAALVNISVWNEDMGLKFSDSLFEKPLESAIARRLAHPSLHCGVLTFLGCIIVRKGAGIIRTLEENSMSNYAHVYAFLEAGGQSALLLPRPAIKQRLRHGLRWDVEELYLHDYPRLFQAFRQHGIPEPVLRRWKNFLLRKEIVRLLLGDKLRHGRFKWGTMRKLVWEYGDSVWTWLLVVPAYCIPCFALKIVRRRFGYGR